ncbi:uncharacterized protein LOC125496702 [Beta vulgaris subsp. vulgaris]|uniref:uncharacterized protein LOC125496702 n=1 Tax=Beta vulgaris subsp. vulgaris TaxID=3555 RepID=UPI002036F3A1|nr:uncharacterized protein LOC125496702 [Beta vulgaris subsp. vulgaris]
MEISMCIVVHHGGRWVHKPDLVYEGGEVKIINDLPSDLDVNYLRSLINSLGHKNVIKLHYCDPFKELKLGLRFLDYDSTTFGMFLSLLEKCRMIDLFTEHEDLPTEVINVDESDKHNRELIDLDENDVVWNAYVETCHVLKDVDENDPNMSQSLSLGSVESNDIDYDDQGTDNEDGEVIDARDTYFSKNDAKKVGARCKSQKCPFYVWCSLERGKGHLVVKTLVPTHNCGRLATVKKIRAAWIAKTYQQNFKINPYMKCQEIVDTLWAERGIKASLWLALKARRKAQALILGEYEEQYGLLHRYAQELLKSNRNNTIKFKLIHGVFERLYVCFDALKRGFIAGCRPFFGIDGCFLKGPFGGQLLVAVGRDGNNQMFPIAWACVEVESTDSWGWFLQLLADDLGTSDGHGYTIMSDQQKGLLNVVSQIWPKADTRCCARHAYCNFRQVFGGGLEYKRGFWKIAKSTTDLTSIDTWSFLVIYQRLLQ